MNYISMISPSQRGHQDPQQQTKRDTQGLQPVSLYHTRISERAIELVNEVLRSGWVNTGPMVERFEALSREKLGFKYPVAVNNCTSALHLSLLGSGVKKGDEVIIPPQTFLATATAVFLAGAKPVFADIDPMTGNIDPKSIEEKISDKTKAIIAVHWAGLPCDMKAIHKIAKKQNISVIEDAAHALGARIDGEVVGNLSDFTCFSFQAIKHLTTGDGGMVCAGDSKKRDELITRRWFGMDRNRPRGIGNQPTVSELGFKYNMNDVTAALGVGNIEPFLEGLKVRRENGARYRRELSNVPGLTLPNLADGVDHAYWVFPILVEGRDDFFRMMHDRGIHVSSLDFGIDRNPIFKEKASAIEARAGQRVFDRKQIAIPVHEGLDEKLANRIIAVIKAGWG